MKNLYEVKIVGTLVACSEGLLDTWREIAGWAAEQLRARHGDQVVVQYFDLLDADCPPLPQGAQLPVVFLNESVISSGGKISVPLINKKIKEIETENG